MHASRTFCFVVMQALVEGCHVDKCDKPMQLTLTSVVRESTHMLRVRCALHIFGLVLYAEIP